MLRFSLLSLSLLTPAQASRGGESGGGGFSYEMTSIKHALDARKELLQKLSALDEKTFQSVGLDKTDYIAILNRLDIQCTTPGPVAVDPEGATDVKLLDATIDAAGVKKIVAYKEFCEKYNHEEIDVSDYFELKRSLLHEVSHHFNVYSDEKLARGLSMDLMAMVVSTPRERERLLKLLFTPDRPDLATNLRFTVNASAYLDRFLAKEQSEDFSMSFEVPAHFGDLSPLSLSIAGKPQALTNTRAKLILRSLKTVDGGTLFYDWVAIGGDANCTDVQSELYIMRLRDNDIARYCDFAGIHFSFSDEMSHLTGIDPYIHYNEPTPTSSKNEVLFPYSFYERYSGFVVDSGIRYDDHLDNLDHAFNFEMVPISKN